VPRFCIKLLEQAAQNKHNLVLEMNFCLYSCDVARYSALDSNRVFRSVPPLGVKVDELMVQVLNVRRRA